MTREVSCDIFGKREGFLQVTSLCEKLKSLPASNYIFFGLADPQTENYMRVITLWNFFHP